MLEQFFDNILGLSSKGAHNHGGKRIGRSCCSTVNRPVSLPASSLNQRPCGRFLGISYRSDQSVSGIPKEGIRDRRKRVLGPLFQPVEVNPESSIG